LLFFRVFLYSVSSFTRVFPGLLAYLSRNTVIPTIWITKQKKRLWRNSLPIRVILVLQRFRLLFLLIVSKISRITSNHTNKTITLVVVSSWWLQSVVSSSTIWRKKTSLAMLLLSRNLVWENNLVFQTIISKIPVYLQDFFMYKKAVFPFYPKKLASHQLICIMGVVSIIGFIYPHFVWLFGWSGIWWPISHTLASLILFQFLHGGILHLLLNTFFLYQAWGEVETRMSRDRFWYFFITSSVFIASMLTFFSSGITIGMSGFCMALLSYFWVDLFTTRHPLANQILIMLIINIAIWLSGDISFVGHFFGAVWGIVWWYFFREKRWFRV